MSLKELNFGQKVVKTTGGDVTVRGLTFPDITKLVRMHTAEVTMLFGEANDITKKSDAEQDYTAFVAKLLHTAPKLACTIIAMGAGEDTSEEELKKAAEVVSKFPFGVQLTLLNAIGEETFAVEGGAKKVFEIVMGMMKGVSGLKNELNS